MLNFHNSTKMIIIGVTVLVAFVFMSDAFPALFSNGAGSKWIGLG